jgi:hypothetical protein
VSRRTGSSETGGAPSPVAALEDAKKALAEELGRWAAELFFEGKLGADATEAQRGNETPEER